MSRCSLPVERYQRAARFTPPKLASRLSGVLTGGGYWIDHERFFAVLTQSGSDEVIAKEPWIANAALGTVVQATDLAALATLLSDHSDTQITQADLGTADFDMPDGDTLVVTLQETAYHVALQGHSVTRVEQTPSIPALYSPDGKLACFLKDHTVWIKDRQTRVARQFLSDGEPAYAFGYPMESGPAPLSSRAFPTPQGLWSEDSQWFVTHRIDERALQAGGLVEHVPASGLLATMHSYKVATPSDDLPTVEFVAVHVATGRIVSSAARLISPQGLSPFAFRNCWFRNGCLYYLEFDRFCSQVSLVEMNLDSGLLRTAIRETADNGWLELHPLMVGQPIVRVLAESNEVIWFSERDGYGHLYLYDLATGALKHRITQGDWMVRELVHVDEAARRLMFLANRTDGDSDPMLRRLCAVNFDGSGFEILLCPIDDIAVHADIVSGLEQVKPNRPSYAPMGIAKGARFAAAIIGGPSMPTRASIIEIATANEIPIATVDIDKHWPAPKPEPFEVMAADGVTRLYGAMYLPSDFDEAGHYPLVDYIYPGPQLNWYSRRFPGAVGGLLQSVVELGFVGIVVESRGLPFRSRDFHQAGGGNMHEPQLSDHAAAIKQLCERHSFIDLERIGIFGQSGGGHAAARALFDYPDTFKVGVSVCGNHDSRNYISHWLDKYGGRPGTPEREVQSNIDAAHRLQGKLFLMHGDMDDNVHLAQTLAVSAALIAAGKPFDQLVVPGADHNIVGQSGFAVQRIWDFFVRHLLGAEPPPDFVLSFERAEIMAGMRLTLSEML